MTTFNSPKDFSEHKQYVPLLKKALAHVKFEEPKKFVYFKEYPFAEKKLQCVLVDFSPQCLDELKTKARRVPTAEGMVSLTAQDELKFESHKGTFKAIWLKKYFGTMGDGIKDVAVDPNETDDDAAAAPAFRLATPPAGKFVRPNAPRSPAPLTPPAANPTRPGGTPVLPPGQAPQPIAAAPNAGAPVQKRPAAAAPLAPPAQRPAAPAAAKPPGHVAIPLPENKGDQESLVEGYIAALAKADLSIKDPGKKNVLDKALQLSNAGEYAHALHLLNELVGDVTYPGVEEWALQKPLRKYEVELLTEQFFGFLNLIEHKRKQPRDWSAEETEIRALITQAKTFNDGINNGLLAANPASVKKAFDLWAPLVARRNELAGELKKIWLADQTARLEKEAGKSKASSNIRMANSYGKEAVMELAQMAEIQAIRYANSPANKNAPVAQGDWHKKLEIAELAAIYGYSTADYTAIGQLLRGRPPENDAQKQMLEANKKRFAEYIEAGKKGLAKLPAYKGEPGVRCTKSLWQETIDEIATTGAHVEKSFMSVGKKKVAGFGDIEWHFVKFTTGKDITMFSLHQTEGEILFPPGSKFKFIKGEVLDASNQKVEFSDARQMAKHVTPATKVGKFWFEQIG